MRCPLNGAKDSIDRLGQLSELLQCWPHIMVYKIDRSCSPKKPISECIMCFILNVFSLGPREDSNLTITVVTKSLH